MMTIQMDNAIATPSSRELAESLFKKNLKLEARLKKLAESKLPSDPNIWLEIRENLEGIVLADHDFSQKNDCETALWQLHYRRIEEFRYHVSSASTASSNNPKNNNQTNADRLKRIKGSFKVFLSEATGFYHELMLKIRSKYGLPLNGDNLVVNVKDENKAAEMKKGLMSCHRCLIYLGDLARYKGLYGEGEVVSREFGAASSYYMQALSMCPASGNPHHQLGILATYSRDELLVIYRYFRSLAVDSPFTMARENLVIAFDKNRLQYSSLTTNSGTKAPSARAPPARSAGKCKGRGDRTSPVKESKKEPVSPKEPEISIPEIFKAFCVKFVRLNGILFTKTSLETFEEVFSSLMRDFQNLLSSGPEEPNFGLDYTENALLILRAVAILIYTVHNVKRESEGKSYAGVVQRNLLLQNAFTASFQLVGQILKRCSEVKDTASSFYLSGILVYIEWLACNPDIAAGSDMDEKQAIARSFFWNQCVSLLNRLALSGLAPVETDKDVSCFFEMSGYDETETGNRIALWEDFELRGFLPLVPAQIILDFSRKSDGGIKEKKARVERILAAGQALTSMVQIGPMKIYFDPGPKKFVISKDPPEIEAPAVTGLEPNGIRHLIENLSDRELYVEGDEDEVIVFQPNTFIEKPPLPSNSMSKPSADFIQHSSASSWDGTTVVPFSTPLNGPPQMPAILDDGSDLRNVTPELPPYASSSNCLAEKEAFLSAGLKELSVAENGALEQQLVGGGLGVIPPVSFSTHVPSPVGVNNHNLVTGAASEGFRHQLAPQYFPSAPAVSGSMALPNHLLPSADAPTIMQSLLAGMTSNGFVHQLPPSQFPPPPAFSDKTALPDHLLASTAAQPITPSVLDFGVMNSDGMATRFMEKQPVASRKNPVSRPVRHMGPPPGFGTPVKQQNESIPSSVRKEQPLYPQTDDYGWLDGYQPSANQNVTNHVGCNNFTTAATGEMFGTSFGFATPGTQVSGAPAVPVNGNTKWQDFHLFEPTKLHNNEHQMPLQGETQIGVLGEQHTAQSLWSGRYFV